MATDDDVSLDQLLAFERADSPPNFVSMDDSPHGLDDMLFGHAILTTASAIPGAAASVNNDGGSNGPPVPALASGDGSTNVFSNLLRKQSTNEITLHQELDQKLTDVFGTPPDLNSINAKKKVDLSVVGNYWAKAFVKRGDDKYAPAETHSNGTKKFYSFAAAHGLLIDSLEAGYRFYQKDKAGNLTVYRTDWDAIVKKVHTKLYKKYIAQPKRGTKGGAGK